MSRSQKLKRLLNLENHSNRWSETELPVFDAHLLESNLEFRLDNIDDLLAYLIVTSLSGFDNTLYRSRSYSYVFDKTTDTEKIVDPNESKRLLPTIPENISDEIKKTNCFVIDTADPKLIEIFDNAGFKDAWTHDERTKGRIYNFNLNNDQEYKNFAGALFTIQANKLMARIKPVNFIPTDENQEQNQPRINPINAKRRLMELKNYFENGLDLRGQLHAPYQKALKDLNTALKKTASIS